MSMDVCIALAKAALPYAINGVTSVVKRETEACEAYQSKADKHEEKCDELQSKLHDILKRNLSENQE